MSVAMRAHTHAAKMSVRPGVVLLTGIAALALSLVVVPAAPAQVGVDGVIGPEWAGVTPTTVPWTGGTCNGDGITACTSDAGCPPGELCTGAEPNPTFVGFNVYVRTDADYFYFAFEALPATNPSGWDDAYTLSLGSSANVYLDTDPLTTSGPTAGSDIIFQPLGGFILPGPVYSNADDSIEAPIAPPMSIWPVMMADRRQTRWAPRVGSASLPFRGVCWKMIPMASVFRGSPRPAPW